MATVADHTAALKPPPNASGNTNTVTGMRSMGKRIIRAPSSRCQGLRNLSVLVLQFLVVGGEARCTVPVMWPVLRLRGGDATEFWLESAMDAALGHSGSAQHRLSAPPSNCLQIYCDKRSQIRSARSNSRSRLYDKCFGLLPYTRPGSANDVEDPYYLATPIVEERSLVDYDAPVSQTFGMDPALEEFNSKLPLAASAHSDADDLKGEVQIQQALVQQLKLDLDDTREEAAQLQRANDALQSKVEELAKANEAALQREQEKRIEMQRLEKQLSLVEKELNWERRLLEQQRRLLQEQVDKISNLSSEEPNTVTPEILQQQLQGSDVTESYSDSTSGNLPGASTSKKSAAKIKCRRHDQTKRRNLVTDAGDTEDVEEREAVDVRRGKWLELPYVPLVDFDGE